MAMDGDSEDLMDKLLEYVEFYESGGFTVRNDEEGQPMIFYIGSVGVGSIRISGDEYHCTYTKGSRTYCRAYKTPKGATNYLIQKVG